MDGHIVFGIQYIPLSNPNKKPWLRRKPNYPSQIYGSTVAKHSWMHWLHKDTGDKGASLIKVNAACWFLTLSLLIERVLSPKSPAARALSHRALAVELEAHRATKATKPRLARLRSKKRTIGKHVTLQVRTTALNRSKPL